MCGEISITDSLYPVLLRQIPDPPKVLYYKGHIEAGIFENCLAVVGSRKMSLYGKRVVESFVSDFAHVGITVVSGFMYGIDALSHSVAVKNGGKTIAVLPCGVDIVYPSYQQDLYDSILASGGVLLSELPCGFKATNWTFPKRNRLVAGLAKATLVIEAGANSGSLITARFALKYDSKLFVVPGDVFAENSDGIYQLVREGASLATTACDIRSFLGVQAFDMSMDVTSTVVGANIRVQEVYSLLKKQRMGLEELVMCTSMSFVELSSIITQLELTGYIVGSGGLYYANKT